ncbi:hypothetical protein Tco_0241440 [Tanacetum coccineum]
MTLNHLFPPTLLAAMVVMIQELQVRRHPRYAKEVVENSIESEVVFGLPEEFQEGDMVDALSRVEQKSLENWKELDNESEDKKVERDSEREGEPTILATFCSDRESCDAFDPRVKIFACDPSRDEFLMFLS